MPVSKRYQNIFFVFGLAVLAFMVSQLDFHVVGQGLAHAGYWFLAVLALWAVLYVLNTAAWWLILQNGKKPKDGDVDSGEVGQGGVDGAVARPKLGFLHLYRLTVSGFALNYATPGGLMGGEPYRILAITPYVGAERATSSVVLYAMTHIFSHFWFWLLSAFLFAILHPVSVFMACLLMAVVAFCALGIWFFLKGYRHGLAMSVMRVVTRVPLVRAWATRFVATHEKALAKVDEQIAALHRQRPWTFAGAVGLELACRVASALEIYFILRVLMPSVGYPDCILILAFTSLLANLLFFMPLQLGGREGGFVLSAEGLGLTSNAGIFVALIVRLRELIWVAIGLLFIKLEPRQRQTEK